MTHACSAGSCLAACLPAGLLVCLRRSLLMRSRVLVCRMRCGKVKCLQMMIQSAHLLLQKMQLSQRQV